MKKTKIGIFMKKYVTKGALFIAKHPVLYYILNLTWGLPLTLLGYITTLVLLPWTIRIYKYHYIYSVQTVLFSHGLEWGFEMGTCFFTSMGAWTSNSLRCHEFGHTCQNALLGPFQIFLVWIPSMIRFWYRGRLLRKGIRSPITYDAIWFEGSATKIGCEYYVWDQTRRLKKQMAEKDKQASEKESQ